MVLRGLVGVRLNLLHRVQWVVLALSLRATVRGSGPLPVLGRTQAGV